MKAFRCVVLLIVGLNEASCVSQELISPEKRSLISGILTVYFEHKPLSDEELTRAFHSTPSEFKKYCIYKCKSTETLSTDSPRPDQALKGLYMSGFTANVAGITDPDYHGWAGKQILIVFNPLDHYCLSGDEFALFTSLKHKIAPAGLLVDRGASVSWPARYVFQEPGGRNTIAFDPGCVHAVTVDIYFNRPDPD